MGLFVSVTIDRQKCPPGCRLCVDACPVNILAPDAQGGAFSIEANEDECTFCDLCLARCPTNAIAIAKHY